MIGPAPRRVAERLMARGMSVLVKSYRRRDSTSRFPCSAAGSALVLGIVRPGSNWASGVITEDLKQNDPLGYEMFDAGESALAPALESDAAALWAAAGPIDYLRLDYRFDPVSRRRVFLEFNICCHIGRSGAICLAAAQWGLTRRPMFSAM